MSRFDLIDEYTCVFVPGRRRSRGRTDVTRPISGARGRFANVRWNSILAGTVGLAILFAAAVTL